MKFYQICSIFKSINSGQRTSIWRHFPKSHDERVVAGTSFYTIIHCPIDRRSCSTRVQRDWNCMNNELEKEVPFAEKIHNPFFSRLSQCMSSSVRLLITSNEYKQFEECFALLPLHDDFWSSWALPIYSTVAVWSWTTFGRTVSPDPCPARLPVQYSWGSTKIHICSAVDKSTEHIRK